MNPLWAALMIVTAPLAWAQGHGHCSMAPSAAHRGEVDHRHDEVTGVGHDAAEHHFVLAKDGGSIRLEVKDPGQLEARDLIRQHLRAIARSFGAGDFSMPMRIHDQAPPGVEVMRARRAAIRYSYAATGKGGIVQISTKDPTARDAVQEFLRFQISDHGTGDPTERVTQRRR
jgi:hypothetical protein